MKKNGFTLIELMIVVAIIGIVAAVVAPAFTSRNKNSSVDGFGNRTPITAAERPDTLAKCIDGFLFKKEMGGEWKPDRAGTRCEK